MLERAVEIARATEGAFDPTVGPLVLLWREARQTARMPDASAIARAREAVGWRRIEFDKSKRAVRLSRPDMRLDLGGIAKGYILEEALRTLRAAGVRRALIEAGGDIVVGDAPPDRDGWRIDVIGADREFAARAAKLTNAALATSGPTAQFVEIDGVRYSHVVDPRTGVGLTNHSDCARHRARRCYGRCSGNSVDYCAGGQRPRNPLAVSRGARGCGAGAVVSGSLLAVRCCPLAAAVVSLFRLPTADCRLPTADCRLPTADCDRE